MLTDSSTLPIIDLSGYLHPTSPEGKAKVVRDVRTACSKYGFLLVSGHGVALDKQQGLFQGLENFFHQSKDEKMKYSFLKNPGRRGYEASGDSLREGDALPDSKESFYIGREDPVLEAPGFHCPNVWPELADQDFRDPIWAYYEDTSKLGRTIWEILLEGLGHTPDLLDDFAKRPIVQMKMIRYPPVLSTLPGQFGVGAHTDFGGVTILLQQPGKQGLEVWYETKQEWLPIPAPEDVLVINCGDMIQKWSGGRYKSAKHRVINRGDTERLSCAMFWHGDVNATNPLDPTDPSKDTVGHLLVKRFKNQFSLPNML